jgi:alkylation response protein AidB-like acyl-CoA dehydrogenase
VDNYFTDNEDLQFYLNDPRLEYIFELREKGYTENHEYPFAPENFEDALDNCLRVLSLVGQLSAEILAPAATDIDRHGCTLENNKVSYAPGTKDTLKRFAQAELFGFTLPRKYGGLNFPLTIYMMAVEIVSRAEASFMNLYGLQEIAETIYEFASSELKAQYLPKMASGRFSGAMVLTEPEAGSDLQAIKLRATYDEKEECWRLNGVKHFISNGCGDILLVFARSEENTHGGRGLSLFLYEKDENLVVRRLEDKLGIHGSPTCELEFKNCRAHLIGKRKRGLTQYFVPLMNGARIGVGAQSIGIAQEAFTLALNYANQRKQFGKSIIEFPPVLEMLTDMRVRIEAARSLLYESSIIVDLQHAYARYGANDKETAVKIKELSRLAGLLTPMAKYYASEMCNKVTYDAIQIFGGAGYTKDYDVERLYRDARITTIYEGTSQLQIIAAIGGLTSGLFFKLLSEKLSIRFPEKFRPMIKKIKMCENSLKKAVYYVKDHDNHIYMEYHARGLVDMAVEILMAVLLLKNSRESDRKFNLAEKFVNDTFHRVQMLAGRIIFSDENIVDRHRHLLEETFTSTRIDASAVKALSDII